MTKCPAILLPLPIDCAGISRLYALKPIGWWGNGGEGVRNPLCAMKRIQKTMKITYCCRVIAMIFVACLCWSCGDWREPAATTSSFAPIFPDYKDVAMPINIAPPDFGVEEATHIQSVMRCGDKEVRLCGKDYIEIPFDDWQALKNEALSRKTAGGQIEVSVSAWTKGNPNGVTYKPFHITVSPDSIDPYICYRLIPPGYQAWNTMGIYQRNLSNYDEEAIVTNAQNAHGCVNCHSLAQYSPQKGFLFHARGQGGGTVVYSGGALKKVALESMGPMRSGTYPMWHPEGRWVVFSSNVTHQSFYAHSQDKIEVYDNSSDLILYDSKTDRVLTDPRFCDSLHWETFPAFSPDGRWLYVCQAKPVQMPTRFNDLHYSLLRVPFDAETGSLGQEVDTVYSAAAKGGSVSFPRISPDGRWLLYTWSQCATFPIHHKEADLRMIDLYSPDFHEVTDIGPINSKDVDSYHSWSSNGKWVIFSSKRIDGRYTRLFLSHWDGRRFSKPMLLPQREPAHNVWRMYSYNIPEFMSAPVHFDADELSRLLAPD